MARPTMVLLKQAHDQERPRSGIALICLAILIVAVEMGRYWLVNHPLRWQPEAIAFVLGFAGFYIINPKRTLAGATFLINGATALIGSVRPGGRRATDPPLIVPDVGNTMTEPQPAVPNPRMSGTTTPPEPAPDQDGGQGAH